MKTPQKSQHVVWRNAGILLLMAGLIVFALKPWGAWQATNPNYYGWNLFSFFTTQSNVVAAFIYIIAATAILRRKELGGWFRYVRGAGVLYMLITGIVYTLLLAKYEQGSPNTWQNVILHQFGPLFIVAWWLLWPSKKPISPKGALWLLAFPVAWIVYTLVRAQFVHWYPYPFLDPAHVGSHGMVWLYIAGIAITFIGASQVVAWASRVRASNRSLY